MEERFRPNSRWLATMTGVPVDEINRALHHLLYQRRLTMGSGDILDLGEPLMGNPVVRWQIISPAADATASFYTKLFGWTASQDNALGYRELKTGGEGIDGGVWPGPPQERPFVQLFVAVPDIDACMANAERLGAKVIVPKSVRVTPPHGDANGGAA